MNRAIMMRITTCALMGLGAALLVAAVLLSTYTANALAKIPLNIDTTLVSTGVGTALDPDSLTTDHAVVNADVPLIAQQQIEVEAPTNADIVTLQNGATLRRADKPQDTGLLLAIVDTVTLNRQTALAVSDDIHPKGWVQKPRSFDDHNPPTNITLIHQGLSYRFPYHTRKQSYPYFDVIAQRAADVHYEDTDDINGLTTYRFTQDIGYDHNGNLVDPVKYPSLHGHNEDGEITAPARVWDIPADNPDELVTMTRYYAAQRTFWVEPESGIIIKSTVHANHYYTREDPHTPEVILVDYTVTTNEQTIEHQVQAAQQIRNQLGLWTRILPITCTALGIIALAGGLFAGWFSLPIESILAKQKMHDTHTEPGLLAGLNLKGHQPPTVSGAEAETEKLPKQYLDTAASSAGEQSSSSTNQPSPSNPPPQS